jgi:hypothetical protein
LFIIPTDNDKLTRFVNKTNNVGNTNQNI